MAKEMYVIAELGFNHNGDRETAVELIKASAQAGADCAKLQLFRTDHLLSSVYTEKNVIEIFRKHEVSKEDYLYCKEIAEKEGIALAASVFDTELLEWYIRETDPPFIKIASPDITYQRLLIETGKTGLPVILSAGGATEKEITQALEWLKAEQNQVSLMHCIPRYPAPDQDLNLACIPWLKERFGLPVGFSDHSENTTAPLIASRLGATLWERHVTLDKEQPGPEHAFSLEMKKFEGVIKHFEPIQSSPPEEIGPNAREQIGEPELPLTEEIKTFRKNARRSLMADRPLSAGSILQEDMIRELRPGTGLPAGKIDQCIGMQIQRPTDPLHMISY